MCVSLSPKGPYFHLLITKLLWTIRLLSMCSCTLLLWPSYVFNWSSLCTSYSCQHDIRGRPIRNFFIFSTSVLFDLRMTLLDFVSQRSKGKVTETSHLYYSHYIENSGMLIIGNISYLDGYWIGDINPRCPPYNFAECCVENVRVRDSSAGAMKGV